MSGSRVLLRLVLEHIADGGIVLPIDGEIVLTWADAGVSRQITHSGDP